MTAGGGPHSGSGGLDPVTNGGTIGVNGGPRPPSGGTGGSGGIGHNGGGGHGHNGNGGGIGINGGGGTGFNGGGGIHINNGFNNGWTWTQQSCNNFQSYGYYDYFNHFGGNVNNGFCYNGFWGGVNFTLVYPFLNPGCQVVNIVPRRNRRVVILQSDCGTFWWRVVERRTWVPGYYAWVNGCNRWIDGYWSWRVVQRQQVWDYDYCNECYF